MSVLSPRYSSANLLSTKRLALLAIPAFFLILNISNSLAQKPAIVPVPGVKDPAQMDILGLRLYMTGAEAAAILEQRLQVKTTYITVTDSLIHHCSAGVHSCGIITLSGWTRGITYTASIDVYGLSQFKRLSLLFLESYPFDPKHPESLVSIEYEPQLNTKADTEAFIQAVVQKYGEPLRQIFNDDSRWTNGVHWCAFGMKLDYKIEPPLYDCDYEHPDMHMFSGHLILEDNDLRKRESEAWQMKRTTAPPL